MKKNKTRAEVLQWLKDKGVYNVIARRLPYPIERHVTCDRDLDSFLTTAFDWEYSHEGRDYWAQINREYTEWYNSNTNAK